MVPGTPGQQLRDQVTYLMSHLPVCDVDLRRRSGRVHFARVEGVAPGYGFVQHDPEVRVDCHEWGRVSPKARELRMPGVATRLPREDGSRQQGLTPECDETAPVEMLRVQGPESHVCRAMAVGSRQWAVKSGSRPLSHISSHVTPSLRSPAFAGAGRAGSSRLRFAPPRSRGQAG